MKAQLAPLETALLAAARTEAAARLQEAEARAETMASEGAARARTLLEDAKAEGRRAAEVETAHRLVEARRQARSLVLGAQRAAYDRFVGAAIAAVETLAGQPEYEKVEGQLVEAAKATLGGDAEVVRNPDGQPGVHARNGSRFADLTLATLARRCIEGLGERVMGLWL